MTNHSSKEGVATYPDDSGWQWCTAEGARQDVIEQSRRRSFLEKIIWLEEAEDIAIRLRRSRDEGGNLKAQALKS